MRFVLGLTVIGWMCLPATPQSLFDSSTGQTMAWDSSTWTGGTISGMVSGDFTGDFYRDLVVRDGTQLVLVFGPGVFDARSPLGTDGVSGFCAVPGPAGSDVLVVANSTGWRTIEIDYEVSGHVVESSTTIDGDWANAKALQLVPELGNNAAKVAALSEDGDKLLLLSSPLASSSTNGLALSDAGLALAVVDWDDEDWHEIAVLNDGGIVVYDTDLDVVVSIPHPYSGALSAGALVAFHQAGKDEERLAAVIQRSGQQPALWIVDSLDDEGPYTMTIDDTYPYALAAGNVQGDATDEILVAHNDPTVSGPVLYKCTGTGGPGGSCLFNTSEVLSIGITDLAGQESLPVLADFTADGDVDIGWFFEDDEVLRIAENNSADHTDFFIELETTSRAQIDPFDSAGELGQMKIYLREPLEDMDPVTGTTRKILVEEWYQNEEDSMQPIGAQAFLLNYPGTGLWGTTYYERFLWPSWVPMDGVTNLTIRVVRIQSGAVVEVGPACMYSLAVGTEALLYLDAIVPHFSAMQFQGRDLTDPPATDPPDYPPSGFYNNSYISAGGGKPPQPPPMGNGAPPKVPKPVFP